MYVYIYIGIRIGGEILVYAINIIISDGLDIIFRTQATASNDPHIGKNKNK